jgi:hypothetical protein
LKVAASGVDHLESEVGDNAHGDVVAVRRSRAEERRRRAGELGDTPLIDSMTSATLALPATP